MNLNIDERRVWSEDLRFLLNRYPRETWKTQNSSLAQFWLEKHDYIRYQCTSLTTVNNNYREEQILIPEFCARIVPLLQRFFSGLQGHHQIEDAHYFPSFRAVEKRLSSGFDILAEDHELLHQGIAETINVVNTLIESIDNKTKNNLNSQQHIVDQYIEASELLSQYLLHHLDDEEDLVIPIMLKLGQ